MFNSIEEAVRDFKQGKMIIVLDNEDRENEGDLVMAGELVDGESINFMIKYGGGLICTPISEKIGEKLGLDSMTPKNTDPKGTAFTVSIDSKKCKTGISAFERALTIKELCDEEACESWFSKPGHIFPLIAKDGGVLEREGHTEASIDLCRLSGLKDVAIICEIVGESGEMSKRDDLVQFAQEHNLKMITIEELIKYRKINENIMSIEAETVMPTKHGEFKMIGFTEKYSGKEHVALVKGELEQDDEVLVRIHSECLTGDAFGSMRCDCGDQLQEAMSRVSKEGKGAVLYLRQEGRGIGLINKIKAYNLQDKGRDTVDANIELGFHEDLRDYAIAADMLKQLGIKKVKLMTNNPDKVNQLQKYDIQVTERVELEIDSNCSNKRYLSTKKERMGHMFKNI